MRLYTDHPLSRQAQINLYLHYLCHNLVRELVKLQVEHAALRNRFDALSQPAAPPGGPPQPPAGAPGGGARA